MTDVKNMQWWPDALDVLSIDEQQLGTLVRLGTNIGTVNPQGQTMLGLSGKTTFTVGSLDHHIAAIGAGVGTTADMSESTGTVLACVNLTNNYAPKADVCIGPGLKKNQYWQLTWDTNGAAGLEWYQRNYAKELSLYQLIELAEHALSGCDGLKAKSMCWTYPDLTGFDGVTNKHNHSHFIRAIMESTADTLKVITKRLCGTTSLPETIAATGGGAKSDLWLKIKSDTLGTKVISLDCPEPACRGAAILAEKATD